MGVTIKDVAQAANVSVASVSRVLNGHSTVTQETRDHILAVMQRLRYVPHVGARSLSTNLTNTVGVLLPDLYGEFFSEVIRGIDGAARSRGLHLLVASLHGGAAEAGAAIRTMRGRVDGLLIMSPHVDAELLAQNLPERLPVVLLNSGAGGGAYPSLSIDNYSAAYAMVRHLAARGHRSIAFIAGPPDNFEAQERLRGYRAALAELLPGARELVFEGDFTEPSGTRAGTLLARRKTRPDAVFAANDMMAIGAQIALRQAGIAVPDDIALAGFDDIPVARYVTPALTTVRVPIAELGAQALERLTGLIAGGAAKAAGSDDAAGATAQGTENADNADNTDKNAGADAGATATLDAQLVVRASSGLPSRIHKKGD